MSDWKASLGFVERYDNIDKLRKSFQARGQGSSKTPQEAALAAESEAYNTAESKEAYYAVCNSIIGAGEALGETGVVDDPPGPGIIIGTFHDCRHVASGLASEVYKSKNIALKVITETHNVEPHNPGREVKILQQLSHANIIKLSDTFKDQEGRLAMAFPFMPLTLAKLIESDPLSTYSKKQCFHELFSALDYLHQQGIIHRDVKPSNILLASPTGPAYLSDFGTTWHPILSTDEPGDHKCLEVGTTCYRAPETLFGNRSYDTKLDMWAAGAMFVECIRQPPMPLFESRDTSEDGNQLGLILSIFKTLGTPTPKTWPEALSFTTPPFEWYREFPGVSLDELLPDADENAKNLVRNLMVYESGWRLTALQALNHPYIAM